jgi:hypothetical protein
MDLDLGEIGAGAFRDEVREILASRPFAQVLEARGIAIERVSEPKQTSSPSSLRPTAPRLAAGSIRLTIDRATLGLNAFGHSTSGSARNSRDRAGVRYLHRELGALLP